MRTSKLAAAFAFFFLLSCTLSFSDVPGRRSPAGTTVPNPGTQEQELANITFPAPYNVFEFVVTCGACHSGTVDQQAAHFGNWAGTNMASAGRDPVFRANQIIVNSAIRSITGTDGAGNMCFRCHSPNGWYSGRFDPLTNGNPDGSSMEHSILLSTDDEGILCEMCHRTIGGVTMKRSDLDPADPVWNMMSGLRDWPHEGNPYPSGPKEGQPYGDTTLQINDGMFYLGKYPGDRALYFDDLPLNPDFSLGGNYTGQTYGIYPQGWLDIFGNDIGGEVVLGPDGNPVIHLEVPIGPPLKPNGQPDYQAQATSLEHPTGKGDFVTSSEFCGTCHDLTVPILNHGMPEQRTYSEWAASDFGRDPASATYTRCQDCHMPTMKHEYTDDIRISLNPDPVLAGWFPYGKNRNPDGGTSFHKLAGSNRDLPMMMPLLYPEVDLEVVGAPTGRDTRIFPGMMSSRDLTWDRAKRNTELSLMDGVDVTIARGPAYNAGTGKWEVDVKVTNTAGHSIPSGYPDGRRVFLTLKVSDDTAATVFESGYYDQATATLFNDSTKAGFARAHDPLIDSAQNAVMVYERVTGTDSTGGGTAVTSLSLLNNAICFDNRIPPAGFSYAGFQQAGVRFMDYTDNGDGTVSYFEDALRYPDGQNYDLVTYSFDAPPDAVLSARAELYWQTHTREFMEHLRNSDTSTLRPEGPPDVRQPNYPLTPNYLSDRIGLATIVDPFNAAPLNDNWGGIAYASWLLTGMGKPMLVAADDTVAASAPVAAPTATATLVDPFSIRIDWNPVAGAEGYVVWVRYGVETRPESDPASTASWDRLAIVMNDPALLSYSYVNDGLNVAKTYQYKVVPFNGKGMGPESTVVVARTPVDLPMAPSNLRVEGVASTSVTLTWTFAGDPLPDGYIIERQDMPLLPGQGLVPDFVQVFDLNPVPTRSISWVDTTVLPGRTYNYRVAAYNAAGMSLYNDNGPVAAFTLGPPLPATSLSGVINYAIPEISLTWTDNSNDETGFRIERSSDGVTFSTAGFVTVNVTGWTDTAVGAAPQYFYRVYAFNAYGDAYLATNVFNAIFINRAPAFRAPVGNKLATEGVLRTFKCSSATDPDGDTLTYGATVMPAGATFDPATRTFSWTPDYTQAGVHTITFTVTDNHPTIPLSDSETITVTVANVNRAPVFDAPTGNQSVNEGALLRFQCSTATDPDGDAISYTATGLPYGATFNPTTGTFAWTPGYKQAGIYHVAFRATDNDPIRPLYCSETITITVSDVNGPPVFNSLLGNKTAVEGTPRTFVCASASDPDGDVITYSASGLPAGASFDPATRTFSWKPDYTQAGSYNITFTATDDDPVTPLSCSETITLTVVNLNLAPRFYSLIGDKTAQEGALRTFKCSTATDPDGNAITYSATGLPAGATFDPATRTFSWTPSGTQSGIYNITFTATDDDPVNPLSCSETIALTVADTIPNPPAPGPLGLLH